MTVNEPTDNPNRHERYAAAGDDLTDAAIAGARALSELAMKLAASPDSSKEK